MKNKDLINLDDVSLQSVQNEEFGIEDDEVELVTDVEVIEELSEEAKKMQEQALLSAREKAIAVIDRKKLPMALKEIESLSNYTEIMNDPEVWQRVKDNVNTSMDLKFLAEAQKISLQNVQTMLKMDSVNTNGTAGEVFVGVRFGENGGQTEVVVGKR